MSQIPPDSSSNPLVSEGVTPSERYLSKLCNQTFLSMWSYPGLFRNQYHGNTQGDGKEICDLLVVFGSDILIFSDKDCAFPSTGDILQDWSRWFKRAVWASAKQLWGAQRWISSFPDRIFLDRKCTKPFPLELPSSSEAKYHLLVVAHDSANRCIEHFGGTGSGSLVLQPSITGKEHFTKSTRGVIPFAMGNLNPKKEFVHVLDEVTLDLLLGTLDTIWDFVTYLNKKRELITSGRLITAAGEEDLLAYYLQHTDENNQHWFSMPDDINGLLIDEGFWKAFETHEQRLAQVAVNEISYSWDQLIEKFNYHILTGTQHHTTNQDISELEKIVRIMASEPRTQRRSLAISIHELIAKTPLDVKGVRVHPPMKKGGPLYVFLLLPKADFIKTEEEYREGRRLFLEAYCMVSKLKFPAAMDIIGIATETGFDSVRSEDAMYLDAATWTPEMQKEAIDLQKDLGLLKDTEMSGRREFEYPLIETLPDGTSRAISSIPFGQSRNKPCPCGSGLKYKFCHGKNAEERKKRQRKR